MSQPKRDNALYPGKRIEVLMDGGSFRGKYLKESPIGADMPGVGSVPTYLVKLDDGREVEVLGMTILLEVRNEATA